MSRRGLGALAAVAALAALATLAWQLREPRVLAEGEPLPLGREVEMRFVDEKTGATETWKLEKKTTTREESVGKLRLPEPDPAPADRVPDESARTLDAIALEAWKAGEIERALEHLEKAVAADPDDRVPRSHYGRLLTLAADYERALPHLERAAELAPDDPQAWLDLQTLYERSLRVELAWAARERAEALSGGREIRQNPLGYYEIEGAPSFP
jgi:tetratricopeptide (TPR) repeat protein